MVSDSGPGLFTNAGPLSVLALFLGITVLVLGIVVAVRAGRRRHALGLFAAAWLPLPLAFMGKALGDIATYDVVVKLGPAVTPKDVAFALQSAAATSALALLAILLGLSGAVAALARSREDGPST